MYFDPTDNRKKSEQAVRSRPSNINRFMAWLIRQRSAAEVAKYKRCLVSIDTYCLKHGITNYSLFYIYSKYELESLRAVIDLRDIPELPVQWAGFALDAYHAFLVQNGDSFLYRNQTIIKEQGVAYTGFHVQEQPVVLETKKMFEPEPWQLEANTVQGPKEKPSETEKLEEIGKILGDSVLEEKIKQAPFEKKPAENTSQPACMQILFGRNIKNDEPVYWRPNDTDQVFHTNTGIIGTMGTGKTQFTKSMITQLYREQNNNFDGHPLGILIFDYKGDYNESKEDFIQATHAKVLKPYHLPFNPLALTKSKVFKPLLPNHVANAFKDTISKVYRLGAKQENTLLQCMMEAYHMSGIIPAKPATWNCMPPTFRMVYTAYQNSCEYKKKDSLSAAMDKLAMFEIFEDRPERTVSLFDLLKGVVVIDLSGYDPDIQNLIVAITLDLFYAQMQASGSSRMEKNYRQLTKLILVDEADNFMQEGFPSLKKILKEGREFGVGTILSTQFLKHFGTGDDDYSKYILTWVVHNVADLKPNDVDFVFKTAPKSMEEQDLFQEIKKQQKHHSIIKIGNAMPQYVQNRAFWELYRDLQG